MSKHTDIKCVWRSPFFFFSSEGKGIRSPVVRYLRPVPSSPCDFSVGPLASTRSGRIFLVPALIVKCNAYVYILAFFGPKVRKVKNRLQMQVHAILDSVYRGRKLYTATCHPTELFKEAPVLC